MRKLKRLFFIALLILIAAYLLGPEPPEPELNMHLPSVPASMQGIENYIHKKEQELPVRSDNESRILWAGDSVKERTDYCLLYLHGFSASWYEGYPVHKEFARHFGCNAYLPRLAFHGLETDEALIDMTPDGLWESAKEALVIARNLGKKVIIMSTSTGGTLSLKLAADFPEYVDGLILFSPNVRINNNTAFMLSKPWGLQFARWFSDGKYRTTSQDTLTQECDYWYCKYRLESLVALQQLIDETMNPEVFEQVTAPVFLGYYYKDAEHQDDVVKVGAMLRMFDQLGTPARYKKKVAFPEAGTHTIACELFSGATDKIIRETVQFGEEVLQLQPVH